jgi:hypothetical protein
MYYFQQTASRYYFHVGQEQIAEQVRESALSSVVSKLEGYYCHSLRQCHYNCKLLLLREV